MAKLLAVVCVICMCVLAQGGDSTGDMVLHARKAEWKMKDTGFSQTKSCDPPLSGKESKLGIACMEAMQSLQWECPANTIGVLPEDAVRYTMFGWPGQRAGEVHPDVYCIFAK